MALKKDPCKVITGKARSTMMFVTQLTNQDKDGNELDYEWCSTGILIPKKDKKTIAAIEKAIDAACKKKRLKNVGKTTKKFWYPLQDCEEAIADGEFETNTPEVYEDMMYLRAKAYSLPGLVDALNNAIEDPDDRREMCVSGYWFRFSITFKGFSNEMDGVRVQLNNMMFQKEDDRLDGGASATSDFEEFAEEEDDNTPFDEEEDEKPSRKSRGSRRSKRRR